MVDVEHSELGTLDLMAFNGGVLLAVELEIRGACLLSREAVCNECLAGGQLLQLLQAWEAQSYKRQSFLLHLLDASKSKECVMVF